MEEISVPTASTGINSNNGIRDTDDGDIVSLSLGLISSSAVSMIILFGTVTLTTVGMATRTWLIGDTRALKAAHNAFLNIYFSRNYSSSSFITTGFVSSFSSINSNNNNGGWDYNCIYILLFHLTIFGFILFLLYLFEYYPPFPNVVRSEADPDSIAFMIVLAILVSWKYSIVRNDSAGNDRNVVDNTSSSLSLKAQYRQQQQQQPQKLMRTIGEEDNDEAKPPGHGTSTTSSSVASSSNLLSRSSDKFNRRGSNASIEEIDFQQQSTFGIPTKRSIASDDVLSMLSNHDRYETSSSNNNSSSSSSFRNNNNGFGMMVDGSSVTSKSSGGSRSGIFDRKLEEIMLDDRRNDDDSSSDADGRKKNDAISNVVARCPPINDILNVCQCLEWKGMMTTCLLIYQNYNAGSYVSSSLSSDNSVGVDSDGNGTNNNAPSVNYYYNFARLFTGCYVFLSGYSTTMRLHYQGCNNNGYGIPRILRTVLRLNASAIFLCMTLAKPYIFYYVCSIHTYFFFFVYVTLRWNNEENYSKYGLRVKMLSLAVIIYLVWDCNLGLFWAFHSILFGTSQRGISGAPYGQLWEFYFQSYLHHWALISGMVFAINHPVSSLLVRKIESMTWIRRTVSKGVVTLALLGATVMWAVGPLHSSKFTYNSIHPYFGFLPIFLYVYLRNATPALRIHHLAFFRNIGNLSLEIYLLHHHLLLGDDSKSKLILFPGGYPTCNFFIVTLLLYQLAKILRTLTLVLTTLMLPNDEKKCVRNILSLGGAVISFYLIGFVLDRMQMAQPGTIATVTIICGILLYQSIMDMTWIDYRLSSVEPSANKDENESNATLPKDSAISKSSPPLLGTMAVLLLGVSWHFLVRSGSALPLSPLPESCSHDANEGGWFAIDACSDMHRGVAVRDHGIGVNYERCERGEVLQWGWEKNSLTSKCRFRYRSPEQLQTKLFGRYILFVGDTMTRNLFYATCRSLGDSSAGNYDAEMPIHSDITKSFQDTLLEYKWAPLAVDIITKLNGYQSESALSQRPDLIVVGGGIWDLLHIWGTDEDKASHKVSVSRLAKGLTRLQEAGLPTIWFTPTTISTQALNKEEKRTQMSEKSIEEMRKLYANRGVNKAATFVLNGPSFTAERVGESFDGLHYPLHIYDAGAQILANSFDWLLPGSSVAIQRDLILPQIGSMANPYLGLMILCFITIGLLFFDGYFGFSYLSSIAVCGLGKEKNSVPFHASSHQNINSIMPNEVYEETTMRGK